MSPSNNLFALVSAYDLTRPPAVSKEDLREQGQLFLNELMPYIDAIQPLVKKCSRSSESLQCRFDALLCVSYDAGLDLFFDSRLPSLVNTSCSKGKLLEAFNDIPVMNGILRPELEKQMRLYKMPICPRRENEMRLFIGAPIFTFGRCKDPSCHNRIIYGTSVMHPLLQFLSRSK